MGSGSRFDPSFNSNSPNLVDLDKLARLGLSPRQQELNRLWSFYRVQNYEARKCDWDGRERIDPIEHEAVARAGYIPPGFYSASVSALPIKFRRPTAPYALTKVIVDRFTGLLFSERRHPQIRVDGDRETEGTAGAIAEASRLWSEMIKARTYGGATGSVAVGFQFLEGRPIVEVHDPRWVMPKFADRASMRLSELDKRYMYPAEERDPQTGAWVQVWYWYRRLITEKHDVLWKPIVVGDGAEPDWENPSLIETAIEHDFGFCPVVWIQNIPCSDDIDGDSDCAGIYDMVESIDALIAQAHRGIIYNSDPTLALITPDELADVAKGSDNAIKLTSGSANYLEISGSGPKSARELAQEMRAMALEVTQCVLEQPGASAARTATEIERAYSSMLSKADILREQYGERGVKPLVEMMLKAARIATKARIVNGQVERGVLVLPDKVTQNPDGSVVREPRKLGPGGIVRLQWSGYFEPSLQDALSAVQAASAAKAGGLVDNEHAVKMVADHFRIEDVQAALKKIAEEQGAQMDAFAQPGLDQLSAGFEPPPEPTSEMAPAEPSPEVEPVPELPPQTGMLKLTPSDLATIVRVNEARASVGLEPLTHRDGSPNPDGELTLAEFKAKNEAIISAAASAEKGQTQAPMSLPTPAASE